MIYNLEIKGLPFEPHPKQIIYVENTYDEQVNEFIQHNYNTICDHFAEKGYEFVYLPLLSLRFDKDVRSYYNPVCDNSRNIPVKSSLILDYMAHPENRCKIAPSLIYWREGDNTILSLGTTLRGITIDKTNLQDIDFNSLLLEIITDQANVSTAGNIRFSIQRNYSKINADAIEEYTSYSLDRDDASKKTSANRSPYNHIYGYVELKADDTFDEDTKRLVAEIEERVNKLKQKGIAQYVLEKLIYAPIEPSRMVITADYRILLPDYNNIEIEMTPLVKAVYFLFLRHPEGIPFKHLGDYREELRDIYCDVCGGWLTDKMERSVEAATDPFNNSINEKCARIREAFISKFEESLIEPYIVRGKRGEPKGISLPREMVEWQ